MPEKPHYPAFETALNTGDKETLFRLYDLEHTLRVRSEIEKQALLWQLHHKNPNAQPATPGYLSTPTAFEITKNTQPNTQRRVKPAPTRAVSSQDMPI